MADTTFSDEWLAHSLEGVVTPELVAELREKAAPQATLWETLVAQKVVNDEQILTALSTRFRLKIAELDKADPTAKERVPEQVARRYHILPFRATDSYFEVATANPFDLDAEKALAFATAREIRMLLLDPARIAEKLDELYRPEKALDRLLEGMEGSADIVQLADQPPEELNVSAEEAIKRLLEFREGIVLVTGPTGSGKTTTLYSCINQIKSEGVNIVTVEDPVEYRMTGIVQVQVQEKAGLTFAAALRSILRQDPNVV